MKHTFLTVCCLLIMTATITAQNVRKYGNTSESKHELSIYGFGGYSPISYTLDKNGYVSESIGGGAGLGYTFNISSSFGIVTGVEMTMYGAEASFDNITDKYKEETIERPYEFSYSLKNYKEKQSITVFSIPVTAQYGLPLGGSSKFYAAGGFKFGFPTSVKADITPGTATTSMHGIPEDVIYEDMPHHGLVTDKVLPSTQKEPELGFSAALALEAGVGFALTDRINLYTGAYFNYGLNNILKTDDRHLLEYNSADETTFIHNSVLDTGLTNKATLLSIGLKLRIGFKL
jgi:opacity protein-like surface antigen